MLTSISPLGERARASRWWLTTTAYVVSSTLAGIAVGTLAAVLGGLVPETVRSSPAVLAGVALALLAGLLLDLGLGGLRLPTWRRQVDVAWIGRYRGWVVGTGYGAQLGVGVVTIVTSSTTYAVILLAALSGSAPVGALIGGTFGLVRALPLVLMAGVDTRERLWSVLRRVEHDAPIADRVARLALAVGAAALTVVALRGAP
jgi:hypothetical protein